MTQIIPSQLKCVHNHSKLRGREDNAPPIPKVTGPTGYSVPTPCDKLFIIILLVPTSSTVHSLIKWEAAVANGCDAGLPIRRSQVQCSPLLLFPWARNFPIAPVYCADGYTTVLLCRVLVDCMYYQGTAEKQYFYTEQSSLLINPFRTRVMLQV